MTIANLSEELNSIEKGLKILEKIDSNEERDSTTKRGIKKFLVCYEEEEENLARKHCWNI